MGNGYCNSKIILDLFLFNPLQIENNVNIFTRYLSCACFGYNTFLVFHIMDKFCDSVSVIIAKKTTQSCNIIYQLVTVLNREKQSLQAVNHDVVLCAPDNPFRHVHQTWVTKFNKQVL